MNMNCHSESAVTSYHMLPTKALQYSCGISRIADELVFVYALNELNKSVDYEPDQRCGYDFLEQTKQLNSSARN